jgi:hypothetical protein
MNKSRLQANVLGFATIGACVMLYRFPPERYRFYPQCPIFRWTHWRCPGCGATRAMAALLHGRVTEALHFNPLFVCVAPLLLGYFVLTYYRVMRNGRMAWPQIPAVLIQCLLALAAVFTLARNAYPL